MIAIGSIVDINWNRDRKTKDKPPSFNTKLVYVIPKNTSPSEEDVSKYYGVSLRSKIFKVVGRQCDSDRYVFEKSEGGYIILPSGLLFICDVTQTPPLNAIALKDVQFIKTITQNEAWNMISDLTVVGTTKSKLQRIIDILNEDNMVKLEVE